MGALPSPGWKTYQADTREDKGRPGTHSLTSGGLTRVLITKQTAKNDEKGKNKQPLNRGYKIVDKI